MFGFACQNNSKDCEWYSACISRNNYISLMQTDKSKKEYKCEFPPPSLSARNTGYKLLHCVSLLCVILSPRVLFRSVRLSFTLCYLFCPARHLTHRKWKVFIHESRYSSWRSRRISHASTRVAGTRNNLCLILNDR